ncbi:MAG: hypothetical protein ABIN08_23550, partial [Caldimonas sp.]
MEKIMEESKKASSQGFDQPAGHHHHDAPTAGAFCCSSATASPAAEKAPVAVAPARGCGCGQPK